MAGKLQAGISGPGNKDLHIGKAFISKWTVKVKAWAAWCQCLWTQLKRSGELLEKNYIEETGQLPLIALKTQTVIRGAAMAVNRNINCQAVSSPAAGNGSTSSSLARSFRSGISSSVSSNYQQSTTSSINEVWGPWRASGNKRRGNPSHPGRYTYWLILYLVSYRIVYRLAT